MAAVYISLPDIPQEVSEHNPESVCFVCNTKKMHYFKIISKSFTPFSRIPYAQCISQALGEDFLVVISLEDKVCHNCSSLIDHRDKLYVDLCETDKNLSDRLKKKYKLPTSTESKVLKDDTVRHQNLRNLHDMIDKSHQTEVWTEEAEAATPSAAKIPKDCSLAKKRNTPVTKKKSVVPNETFEKEYQAVPGCEFASKEKVSDMSGPNSNSLLQFYICNTCNFSSQYASVIKTHQCKAEAKNKIKKKVSKQLQKLSKNITVTKFSEHEKQACNKSKQSEKVDSIVVPVSEVKSSTSTIVHCKICSIVCKNEALLRKHVLMNHEEMSYLSFSDLTCEICGKLFTSYELCLAHKKEHVASTDKAKNSTAIPSTSVVDLTDLSEDTEVETVTVVTAETDIHSMSAVTERNNVPFPNIFRFKPVTSSSSEPSSSASQPTASAESCWVPTIASNATTSTDNQAKIIKVVTEKSSGPTETDSQNVQLIVHRSNDGTPFKIVIAPSLENKKSDAKSVLINNKQVKKSPAKKENVPKRKREITKIEIAPKSAAVDKSSEEENKNIGSEVSIEKSTEPFLNQVFECGICSIRMDSKDELQEHFKTHNLGGKILCTICKVRCLSLNAYKRHLMFHSKPNAIVKCTECGVSVSDIKQHMIDIHICNSTCPFCKEQFRTAEILKAHKRRHNESKPYSCTPCNKYFYKECTLISHNEFFHRDPACKVCGKIIEDRRKLSTHERHHEIEKELCTLCGKVFKGKHSLKIHMGRHKNDYKFRCDFCDKGYASKMALLQHLTARHNALPQVVYTCEKCGKQFNNSSTYKIHRIWHDNPFPYTCSYCGLKLTHSSRLHMHIRRHHTKEKPHACPHCSKRFYTRVTLRKHLSSHTGIYDHNCIECNKGWVKKHGLLTHRYKVHGEPIPKPVKRSKADYKMVIARDEPPSPQPVTEEESDYE